MDVDLKLVPVPLGPESLYRQANPAAVPFSSTAEAGEADEIFGQQRAVDAIRFASRIGKPGFNLFVIGSPKARMRQTVHAMLQEQADTEPVPSDWVYVHNFREPHRPVAIDLPAGRAPKFHDAMKELIEDLRVALPVAFESEDYQTLRSAIDENYQKLQADAFADLGAEAQQRGLVLIRTPMGFALAPAINGKVVPPDEFNGWDEMRKRAVQEAIQELEKELERVVRQLPGWEKKRRNEIRRLDRDVAARAVSQSIEEARAAFQDLPAILNHLDAVEADLIENVAVFIGRAQAEEIAALAAAWGGPFARYEVNVMVTCEEGACAAPVVEELHPTLGNLTGRIEFMARQGALLTNFLLIKPGALHRANGGYLLLDARSLLLEPFAWAALKRMLTKGHIVIEEPARLTGLGSTVTLEPDPIPLEVKIVLFGDRLLYYLLAAHDPDLREHFKVLADFEDDVDRTKESEAAMAHLIAAIARKEALLPIGREGVALMIEHAARLAEDSGKLTLMADDLRDLVIESDFRAREAGREITSRDDIRRALEKRERRSSRLRDQALQSILKELSLIDTEGKKTGQINGLSVIGIGGFRFGRPVRITARVRPGGGRVVDIEREARLGGPIHSKGVMILSGFLAGHYAQEGPMSLHASLVFEQSYGGIDGDSASSAELYALLSALAEVPLRQDIAVTGSVNQHGQVQAIGGVNEKVEGFFDLCQARGLAGTQGVAIPSANVQHLMLREDVVEACRQGKFAIYPIATIDEGIALLSGMPAGARDLEGRYPEGTIHHRVEARLASYAEMLRRFGRQEGDWPDSSAGDEQA